MKKIYLLLILACLSCGTRHHLKKINIEKTPFQLDNVALSDIKNLEKKYNGTEVFKARISLSKAYFPEIDNYDFAQPKIYVRDTLNMKTVVSYFFTKNDSIVRLVEYSWDQDGSQEFFIENLYNLNKKQLTKSLKNEGQEKSEKIDYWWRKKIQWDTDSINVFSFVFGVEEAQRTRVIIRYK